MSLLTAIAGDPLTQLGVGGIFAVILVDRVLGFLRTRKNGQNGKCAHCEECYNLVRDMHIVHSRTDENGIPLVYTPPRLESTLKELSAAITKQTEVLQELLRK